jgi:hypothetical protein
VREWDTQWRSSKTAPSRPRVIDNIGTGRLNLARWHRRIIRVFRTFYPSFPVFDTYPSTYVVFGCRPDHMCPETGDPQYWAFQTDQIHKLVLNICGSTRYRTPEIAPGALVYPVKELVIVFSCFHEPDHGPDPASTCSASDVFRYLIDRLGNYLNLHTEPIKVIFVNDASISMCLYDDYWPMSEDWDTPVPLAVEKSLGAEWIASLAQSGMLSLEYLSLAEYEAKVGREQFLVETHPHYNCVER